MSFRVLLLCVILLCPVGCNEAPQEVPGTQIRMEFLREAGFYAAPFPSIDRQDADGHLDLTGFPNPYEILLVSQSIGLGEEDLDGASVNGAVFFQTTAPLDASSLPGPHESVTPASPVWLINVDPGSVDFLRRTPVTVDYRGDGGPHGAQNLLSVLPVQGFPLRPRTRYAVVIRRTLGDAEGRLLGVPLSMVQLREGIRPSGLGEEAFGAYREALASLAQADLAAADIAGLAVFVTADPVAQMADAYAHSLANDLPTPQGAFELQEVFDDFCTFLGTIDMPVYQDGDPPYSNEGGRWTFDAQGAPVLQATEEARFWITLPRRRVPTGGFPVAVFIRTGGGGDRPLVDRGRRDGHGDPIEEGEGPARYFARAGYAGVSVDGPHGGLRNVSGGDEQFLIFNFTNPAALRDNIRQSALEIALLAHVLETVTLDASDCPGVTGTQVHDVGFDLDHLALMGHSMGATIAPLVLAVEPRYRAVVLSGPGGSWIENMVHKKSPLDVKAVAELLLRYDRHELHTHDPVLTVVQWAADLAEPVSYLRTLLKEPDASGPRHVLMLQGIVDTYILPPMANAYSLGFGLDLAGPVHDDGHPELVQFTPLGDLLDLADTSRVSLPVQGNRTVPGHDPVTAVVIQHPEDGIEDGHEVVFQTPLPKAQYQCFLKTLLAGIPYVPAEAGDPACE